jgi:hypothetical protein
MLNLLPASHSLETLFLSGPATSPVLDSPLELEATVLGDWFWGDGEELPKGLN